MHGADSDRGEGLSQVIRLIVLCAPYVSCRVDGKGDMEDYHNLRALHNLSNSG